MKRSKDKKALITGATSGIGQAIAELFVKKGIDVIICGRRKKRLEDFVQKMTNYKAKIFPLAFDICDKKSVFSSYNDLPEEWKDIHFLINCAGVGHPYVLFQDSDISDWEKVINTNVKGLLYISKAIIPHMIAMQGGHIVNIGSIAGKEVFSKGNIYCASKHAVDAINKALRLDLFKHGIRVTAIHPGIVKTEFAAIRTKGNCQKVEQFYKGFEPIQGKDIAKIVWFIIMQPSHVNINELIVTPIDQPNSYLINRGEK